MRRPAGAPLRPADEGLRLGWAQIADEHLDVLAVGRDATDEQLNQAFRRAARAAHPDLGGDAAQFDRVQRAYDQARESRGRVGSPADPTLSPHDLTPARAASLPRRIIWWLRRVRLTRDHTWFAALLVLFATLAVAISAGWLPMLVVSIALGALLSGRLEWVWFTSMGYLFLMGGGFYVLLGLAFEAQTLNQDGAPGLALVVAVLWAFVILFVVTYRWMMEQRRCANWRVYECFLRSLARQWYAAVDLANVGHHRVWMVRRVHPQSGCTRCEIVEVGTGRRRDVLLAGSPPQGTYLVLDADGMQRAWAPRGSCMAARYGHPDYE